MFREKELQTTFLRRLFLSKLYSGLVDYDACQYDVQAEKENEHSTKIQKIRE